MNQFKTLFISVLLIVFSLFAYSQIPSGYYDSAMGFEGEQLKSALHNIIKNHIEYSYTSSSTDTWDILKESDKDTANHENVILFYSGWSVNAAQEYNSGKGWSREHVWAKSHGDFGTTKGTGTDVHNLRPCDISVNSARGNKDFDSGGELYVDGDGSTQNRTDNDSWEPRNEVKGDVARILFYMAVRYEGDNGEPDLELVDEVNTYSLNEDGKGYHGKLSTLLEWHKTDPVDSFEINRNNVIYSYQQNRNPFIDYPEFVEKIWSTTSIDKVASNRIRVYLNPANEFITIETESQDYTEGRLYTIDGKVILDFEFEGRIQLSVKNLKSGIYIVRLVNKNDVLIEKIVVGQ